MSGKLHLSIEVESDSLVHALGDLNQDALFKLITELDAKEADWSFTFRLAAYFEQQKKLHANDVAKTQLK